MVEVTDTHIELKQRILFEQNTARLRDESHRLLDEVAKILKNFPKLSVIVEGHTDSRGREAYNLKLSQARAAAVVNYLKSSLQTQGVQLSKLTALGLGESRPIDSNRTSRGRANNRRVVFRIER